MALAFVCRPRQHTVFFCLFMYLLFVCNADAVFQHLLLLVQCEKRPQRDVSCSCNNNVHGISQAMSCQCASHVTDMLTSSAAGLRAPFGETKAELSKSSKFRFSRDVRNDRSTITPFITHNMTDSFYNTSLPLTHEHLQVSPSGNGFPAMGSMKWLPF